MRSKCHKGVGRRVSNGIEFIGLVVMNPLRAPSLKNLNKTLYGEQTNKIENLHGAESFLGS
jgi:hypothetical protein